MESIKKRKIETGGSDGQEKKSQEIKQLNKIDSLFSGDTVASEVVRQEVRTGGWDIQLVI